MAVPETARNLRAKNLTKATELKGNVMDMMKQTFDHCQSLKETASIAVKILHARLLSEQERQNQQLQRHQTPQMQQAYDKYMQIANSWRCELRDIDTRLLQLQGCMEQNVPQLRDAVRASNSTEDSSSKTTMKTDSKGTHKRDTPYKGGKLFIKKNRPRLATGGESSDPTLTSTRETSSARSVKKAHRRLSEVAGAAGASVSEVLPHRTRAVNGWVASSSRKKKATTVTPRKHLAPSGKLSGKSARKTRFPKVESGHNTSLVSLTGTPGQGGSSPRHKTTPHPWPDIFKKTGKDGTDTSRVRSNHQSPSAPRTTTSSSDGSKTSIASKRSETTTNTVLGKPSTSTSSELHIADRPEDEATTEGEVAMTSSMPSVGEHGGETAE